MIDEIDLSESTLRVLLWEALRSYSTKDLLTLVRDSDYIVRTAAAKQLHFRPEIEVYDGVLKLCSSSIDFEREIGAFILGQLGISVFPFKEGSITPLIQLISDDSDDVCTAAIVALGHLGADGFIDNDEFILKLLQLANHQNADIRAACAYSLSSINPTSDVIDALNKLCSDSDEDVAEWAMTSLEIIQERFERDSSS